MDTQDWDNFVEDVAAIVRTCAQDLEAVLHTLEEDTSSALYSALQAGHVDVVRAHRNIDLIHRRLEKFHCLDRYKGMGDYV